jgi:guanylate kinase
MEDKVIIITAPSGAGKTTLVKMLLEKHKNLAFSVSACTREKRPGEIDGKDYYFISPQAFQQKIEEDAFIEYEEVYKDNYYGTLKSEIARLWANNKIVVFDIDVMGALRIKRKLGEKALSIFINPPSKEVLIERLKNRKTESEEKINMRIAKADKELSYSQHFDHCLLNDDLGISFSKLEGLLNDFIKRGSA